MTIKHTQGNLLDAPAQALVNTVNTVGVMGKGIALMFKERFKRNFDLYAAACKSKQVRVGRMFITETNELNGPRWIVNFPTKEHWRGASKIEWIVEGLRDLKQFIVDQGVQSIAIPPLGAGNGGLDWPTVRARIDEALGDLSDVDVLVFEPTDQYQNVAKRARVETLTPARALVAELVRRYSVLDMECSLLEVQKLAWFLERAIEHIGTKNELNLQFSANKYGPYATRLRHLLNDLDGSYLHCDKRIADAEPLDAIWFENKRKEVVQTYLKTEAKEYMPVLEATSALIDGFESAYGMELLATVDWLIYREHVEPTIAEIRTALRHWPVPGAGERKERLFDERAVGIALTHLRDSVLYQAV